jgi:rRNA maturation endonuclease Nob1
MKATIEPTFDTPLSYQAKCGGCETLIGMADNYCKQCGVLIDWPAEDEADDTPRRLLTGGRFR